MNKQNYQTMAEIAQIVDVPVATLRSWFTSNYFTLASDDCDASPGGVRRLSPRSVLAIDIAVRFIKLGVPIKRAVDAGNTFARTGHSSSDALIVVPADETRPCSILSVRKNFRSLDILTNIGDGATVIRVKLRNQ